MRDGSRIIDASFYPNLLILFLSFRRQQHGTLDLRGTETSGTGPEDLPSEHTRALGEDRRHRPGAEQERLYEEVQGEATRSLGFKFSFNILQAAK